MNNRRLFLPAFTALFATAMLLPALAKTTAQSRPGERMTGRNPEPAITGKGSAWGATGRWRSARFEPAPADSTAQTRILRLEEDRIQAMLRRDYAALERLMTTDCIHIENNGTKRTTAELMASFRAEPTTFDTFVIDENQVRFYGTTAVVTGRYHNALRVEGKRQPTKYARHTRVWAKQADGNWRMVSHQATRLPQCRGRTTPVPPNESSRCKICTTDEPEPVGCLLAHTASALDRTNQKESVANGFTRYAPL